MSSREPHAVKSEDLPRAKVKKSRLHWLFWLIPAGAAALCVWFIYRDYVATGPLITISFQNADGLEEGNTAVKYRGAQIGRVKSVVLMKDNRSVKVQARLESSASQLARAGSTFWIVRPEVKIGSISGLRTIISGEYIAVQPGTGGSTNEFLGVEQEPLIPAKGSIRIILASAELGSLQEHSPVFFRGIQVGQVLHYELASDSKEVRIETLIDPQYAPLVRVNSKFWNAGGINFSFGLFHGLEVGAESAKTLVSGGVEFATPPDYGAPADNGAVFTLYDKADDAWKKWSADLTQKSSH